MNTNDVNTAAATDSSVTAVPPVEQHASLIRKIGQALVKAGHVAEGAAEAAGAVALSAVLLAASTPEGNGLQFDIEQGGFTKK